MQIAEPDAMVVTVGYQRHLRYGMPVMALSADQISSR